MDWGRTEQALNGYSNTLPQSQLYPVQMLRLDRKSKNTLDGNPLVKMSANCSVVGTLRTGKNAGSDTLADEVQVDLHMLRALMLHGVGCDSPPKLSGPRAPILALMASGGCARVPGNLTRLSSSPTGTHHPKDHPHNRYITVITFDTHTLEIEQKTFTKYTLHFRTQVLQGRKRCIYYKS
jgi:hypothetical protein